MPARLLATTLALAASAWVPAQALTLYDPGLNTLPSEQGWFTLASAAATSQSAAGVYTLNTLGAPDLRFGNARFAPAAMPLDTAAGFVLDFRLQLLAESHTSPNRAGYSLLVVGSDPSRALELAFWTDHVWAQDFVGVADPDRFVHGVDAAWDSQTVAHDYRLTIANHQFTLASGATVLLSGGLRDYRAEGAPYTVPNFIFFGDNSNRGQSLSALGLVSLSPVPEPAAWGLWLAGGAGLAAAGRLRRRRQPVAHSAAVA